MPQKSLMTEHMYSLNKTLKYICDVKTANITISAHGRILVPAKNQPACMREPVCKRGAGRGFRLYVEIAGGETIPLMFNKKKSCQVPIGLY